MPQINQLRKPLEVKVQQSKKVNMGPLIQAILKKVVTNPRVQELLDQDNIPVELIVPNVEKKTFNFLKTVRELPINVAGVLKAAARKIQGNVREIINAEPWEQSIKKEVLENVLKIIDLKINKNIRKVDRMLAVPDNFTFTFPDEE